MAYVRRQAFKQSVIEKYNDSSFLYKAVTAPNYFSGWCVGALFRLASVAFGRRVNALPDVNGIWPGLALGGADTFAASKSFEALLVTKGVAAAGVAAGLHSAAVLWFQLGPLIDTFKGFRAFRAGYSTSFGHSLTPRLAF